MLVAGRRVSTEGGCPPLLVFDGAGWIGRAQASYRDQRSAPLRVPLPAWVPLRDLAAPDVGSKVDQT
jgi:hypothetical protein